MAFKIGCLHAVVWVLFCYNKVTDCTSDFEAFRMKLYSKIIGGTPAALGQAKFIASLHHDPSDYPFGSGHFCGGTLISADVVLTAAHCFDEFLSDQSFLEVADVGVYLGLLNRLVLDENVLKYKIQKLYCHKEFSMAAMNNDIALLFLDAEAPENHKFIQTISLGNAVPMTNCQIYGWGVSKFEQSPDKRPGQLRFATVEVFSLKKCNAALKIYMYPGMLCAGDWGGKTSACQGDSGGPLICNNALVGITSWGIECGRSKRPGVYTNVTHFKDWILHDYVSASSGSAEAFYHSYQNTLIHFPHSVCICAFTILWLEDLCQAWKYLANNRT